MAENKDKARCDMHPDCIDYLKKYSLKSYSKYLGNPGQEPQSYVAQTPANSEKDICNYCRNLQAKNEKKNLSTHGASSKQNDTSPRITENEPSIYSEEPEADGYQQCLSSQTTSRRHNKAQNNLFSELRNTLRGVTTKERVPERREESKTSSQLRNKSQNNQYSELKEEHSKQRANEMKPANLTQCASSQTPPWLSKNTNYARNKSPPTNEGSKDSADEDSYYVTSNNSARSAIIDECNSDEDGLESEHPDVIESSETIVNMAANEKNVRKKFCQEPFDHLRKYSLKGPSEQRQNQTHRYDVNVMQRPGNNTGVNSHRLGFPSGSDGGDADRNYCPNTQTTTHRQRFPQYGEDSELKKQSPNITSNERQQYRSEEPKPKNFTARPENLSKYKMCFEQQMSPPTRGTADAKETRTRSGESRIGTFVQYNSSQASPHLSNIARCKTYSEAENPRSNVAKNDIPQKNAEESKTECPTLDVNSNTEDSLSPNSNLSTKTVVTRQCTGEEKNKVDGSPSRIKEVIESFETVMNTATKKEDAPSGTRPHIMDHINNSFRGPSQLRHNQFDRSQFGAMQGPANHMGVHGHRLGRASGIDGGDADRNYSQPLSKFSLYADSKGANTSNDIRNYPTEDPKTEGFTLCQSSQTTPRYCNVSKAGLFSDLKQHPHTVATEEQYPETTTKKSINSHNSANPQQPQKCSKYSLYCNQKDTPISKLPTHTSEDLAMANYADGCSSFSKYSLPTDTKRSPPINAERLSCRTKEENPQTLTNSHVSKSTPHHLNNSNCTLYSGMNNMPSGVTELIMSPEEEREHCLSLQATPSSHNIYRYDLYSDPNCHPGREHYLVEEPKAQDLTHETNSNIEDWCSGTSKRSEKTVISKRSTSSQLLRMVRSQCKLHDVINKTLKSIRKDNKPEGSECEFKEKIAGDITDSEFSDHIDTIIFTRDVATNISESDFIDRNDHLQIRIDELLATKLMNPMIRKLQRIFLNSRKHEISLLEDLDLLPIRVDEIYQHILNKTENCEEGRQ